MVNANSRRFQLEIDEHRGIVAGEHADEQPAEQRPPRRRRAPRRCAASSALSTSSCRTTRRRDAPIASRTAISRPRALARASSRLARLAQAISSTSAGRRQQHGERLGEIGAQRRDASRRRKRVELEAAIVLRVLGGVVRRQRRLEERRRERGEVLGGAIDRPAGSASRPAAASHHESRRSNRLVSPPANTSSAQSGIGHIVAAADFHSEEPRRRDADDRKREAVERDRLLDRTSASPPSSRCQ